MDISVNLIDGEWRDDGFLEHQRIRLLVTFSWLESVSIVITKVLAAATDHHLSVPSSRLVQFVAHVQVMGLLTLIIPITYQDELAMELQFSDLRFCEPVPP